MMSKQRIRWIILFVFTKQWTTRHAACTPTKRKTKMTKGMSTPEFSGKLSTAIMLQRSDLEWIKTILCVSDSYYLFLGTTIQLDDVVKMWCDSDNAPCIDTTFNLCWRWVTDCCYNNDRVRTNKGKYPILLGPAIVHFQKDVFLFICLAVSLLKWWLKNQVLVTKKRLEQI